jgi:hypothetical protein
MSKINWEKTNVNFQNSSKELITAKVTKTVSLANLRKEYQDLSNEIKSKSTHDNLKIACARHYSSINKWVAGSFTEIGNDVTLYDVTYNQAFDDCIIDGYEFYVVTDGKDGYFNAPKIHPKRNDLVKSGKVTKAIFDGTKKK